ncbi:MAG: tryptophan synthase subunit alpha [Termitinemataceae bacterium]|nr:MAG: tryptophan synthase subunit alpha [Termitinemataceae bacterium]
MSNIANAFKNGKAFIGFVTGGDPCLEKSEAYIHALLEGGADLIEIGIPFSDPVAEGPVIQAANIRSLKAGCTVEGIFGLVQKVRSKSSVPLVFLSYLNPVFRYGYDAFFARCRDCGVDGIIIPDLPFEESGEVKPICQKYGVDLISLISPTSDERIKKIALDADGFIYIVSSMGVTGIRDVIETNVGSLAGAARSSTKRPLAVGFGINTVEQAAHFCKIADGVIVGSAIVKIIAEHGIDGDASNALREYVRNMKAAML